MNIDLKICGVRNQDMLESCLKENIPYIGLNFVPTSRRQIPATFSIDDSYENTQLVGVFQDQPLSEVLEYSAKYGLDMIQLHGEEPLSYIDMLAKPVIKGISLKDAESLEIVQAYCGEVTIVLLDGAQAGSGNTAKANILDQAVNLCRESNQAFAIAGGIHAKNIADFAQKYPDAFFLDTASGVEDSDRNFSRDILHTLITQIS